MTILIFLIFLCGFVFALGGGDSGIENSCLVKAKSKSIFSLRGLREGIKEKKNIPYHSYYDMTIY